MINGIVVGIVKDNVDPNEMHRVLVEYPVDNSDRPKSSWCRMMTPMAGKLRGLVILPDVGTEVVLAFAYRSMSPYIIGAVYNKGEDLPEPYHNDDQEDNIRLFWSRNDHMTIFDDTPGAEQVDMGCKTPSRLDVTAGPIYQTLNSAEKVITEYVEKNTIWETVEKISIKCKDFKLNADMTINMEAMVESRWKSDMTVQIMSGAPQMYNAARTDVNPGSPPPDPMPVETLPTHSHPPTKG